MHRGVGIGGADERRLRGNAVAVGTTGILRELRGQDRARRRRREREADRGRAGEAGGIDLGGHDRVASRSKRTGRERPGAVGVRSGRGGDGAAVDREGQRGARIGGAGAFILLSQPAVPTAITLVACLAVGKFGFGLDTDALRTMAVVTLVFSGQAVFYVARERQHIWSSRPGRWLIMSSIVDLSLFSVLSSNGILMKALSVAIVASLLVAAAVFAFVLDAVKLALFRRLAVS